MVYAESGPRDGGMTLFCTAMLGTEAGIPLLSVKTPLRWLPFSSSSFENLFPDAFGVLSLQMRRARNSPVHQLLVHLCKSTQENKHENKAATHIPIAARWNKAKAVHAGNLRLAPLKAGVSG